MQEHAIGVKVDSSQAETGANTVVRKLGEIKKGAEQAGSSIDKMADSAGKIGSKRAGVEQYGSSVEKLARRASAAEREVEKLQREMARANRSTGELGAGFGRLDKGASGLINRMAALKAAFVTVGVIFLTRQIIQASDAMKRWEAQVRLSQAAGISFAEAWGAVRKLANDTNMSMEGAVTLYSRIALTANEAGYSQQQAARAATTFARALQVNGSTAEEATAATRQFTQALGRGVLKGDEFISMLEGNRRFAKLLADSLGVTVGALQKLAAEGKLTTEAIMRAATDPRFTASLDKQFAQIPITFDVAMQKVKDSATIAMAAFDRGGGFSNALANFASMGAENVETLERRFEDFGSHVGALFSSFAELWRPLQLSGESFFGWLRNQIIELHTMIADLVGEAERIATSFIRGIENAGQGIRSGIISGASGAVGTLIPGAGPYVSSKLERLLPQGTKLTPEFGTFDFGSGRMRSRFWQSLNESNERAMNRGSYVGTEPLGKPTPAEAEEKKTGRAQNPRRTAQEGMQAFISALAGYGIKPTSVFRSYAEQDALYRRLGPGQAARPGTSAHEFWKGIDLPVGTPDRLIYAAADAAGVDVRKIKRHRGTGRHAHVELGDPGRANNENTGRGIEEMLRAEEQRLQAIQKIEQSLVEAAKTAAMLPEEARRHAEVLDLQRALFGEILEDGAALTEEERAQYDVMLKTLGVMQRQRAEAEVMGAIRRQTASAAIEQAALEKEIALRKQFTGEMLEDEIELNRRLAGIRADAMAKDVDLNSEAFRIEMERLTVQERKNIALERQNRLLQQGIAVAEEYGGPATRKWRAIEKVNEDAKILEANKDNLPREVYEELKARLNDAIWAANNTFKTEFSDSINQLAGYFGGKFGSIFQKLANLVAVVVEGARGNLQGAGPFGQLADTLSYLPGMGGVRGGFSDAMKKMAEGNISLSKGFGDFKADMGQMFGKGGSFAKGLGSVLAKAGMGYEMGTMADGIMDAIGIRSSKTGARIGGMIGNTVGGPIGGIIGAIGGGLIGGLFKKTKYGTAVVGPTGDITATGNSKSMRTAAEGAGGAVQSSIEQIADMLGGTVGDYSVSIGQYKGKWRVSTDGYSGKLKKSRATDFGKDGADEAVAFAIKDAIRDGAIQGISEASKRVLTGSSDPTKHLNAVAAYERLGIEVLKLTDPTKAAIEDFMDSMRKLANQMERAGYTAAELTKLEELYSEQRKNLMRELTQPFRDFITDVTMGPNSGKSVAAQYADAKADFAGYQAKLASGERVDQAEFTRIGQMVFDLSRQMFGSTTEQFALDRQALVDASNKAIENVEALTPEETLRQAVDKAGSATVTELQQTNNYLAQILAAIQAQGGNATPAQLSALAANDAYLGSYAWGGW